MKNVWIAFMALFALVMVSSVASAEVLKVRQIYQTDHRINTLVTQSIFLDRTSYDQGMIAHMTDYKNIDYFCTSLVAKYTLKMGGSVIETKSVNLGTVGYATMFYEVDIYTLMLDLGMYTIYSEWTCDGSKLPDSPSISFEVTTPGGTPPVEEECSKTCDVGYKLVNPDSPSCYCEQTWDEDDGVCSAGEPAITPDCVPHITCPGTQIKIEGVCITPDRICKEDGGTASCGTSGFKLSLNIILYALGAIFIIVGGYLTFRK